MNTKVLIPAVATLAAVVAFYMFALAPKREEITRLDTEVTAAEASTQQAEQQVGAYMKAKDDYKANYTTIARLGKAVPADDDVRSLLVQIDAAAKLSKVSFRSLNLAPASAEPAGPAATGATGATGAAAQLAAAPGSVPVGSAGFAAMPFTFNFNGSFFRLSNFFDRLDKFVTVENDNIDVSGRLMLIGSISVTPDATGGFDDLQAQIGAATYLAPGDPASGSTPPTVGGTTPPTAPADGGTVPNTTATITGVR